MRTYVFSRTRMSAVVFLAALWHSFLPACGIAAQAFPDDARQAALSHLRMQTAENERWSTLIMMKYTMEFSRVYSSPSSSAAPSGGSREIGALKVGGTPFTNMRGTWAQDGPRQHSDRDYYTQGELKRGDLYVLDGEVLKWGKKPDFMQGAINYMSAYSWSDHLMTYLGMRPFEGEAYLSDYLVPANASLHDGGESIDGRECYVVDIKRKEPPVYYARMWIDKERGLPVKINHFDKDAASPDARLISAVESIKHHRLPNGGWIPVAGTRTVFYRDNEIRTKSEHVVVDVNTITVDRKNIPESLFHLTFPAGAKVNNAVVGVMTGPDFSFEQLSAQALQRATEIPDAKSQGKDAGSPQDKTAVPGVSRAGEPARAAPRASTAGRSLLAQGTRWTALRALVIALGVGCAAVGILIIRERRKKSHGGSP